MYQADIRPSKADISIIGLNQGSNLPDIRVITGAIREYGHITLVPAQDISPP